MLVRPRWLARRVAYQMIVVRPPDGAAEEKTTVAATDVHDERCGAAEQGGKVERAVGRQFLEGGLRPPRWVKDFASDGYAEFALDMTFRRLIGLHAMARRCVSASKSRRTDSRNVAIGIVAAGQ